MIFNFNILYVKYFDYSINGSAHLIRLTISSKLFCGFVVQQTVQQYHHFEYVPIWQIQLLLHDYEVVFFPDKFWKIIFKVLCKFYINFSKFVISFC